MITITFPLSISAITATEGLREKTDGSNVLVMLDQKARYFFKQGVVADDAGFFD